ncbi:PaaI family thioesterase [Streptomyces sp. NPDC059071]|uniref:PaaI family thioesterase n=1 Tax=unclassified Streptomyces TaxID=2593676 RepID=UPI00363E2A33
MTSPLTAPNTTPHDPAAEDLQRRREAIGALGHELRLLVDATVRTTASPETLNRLAEDIRTLTGTFTGPRRAPADIPAVDEFPGGTRMYSPVTGPGSPLAPPLHVTPAGDGVAGTCTLGIAHEGPPGYGHGGMSAMLLDELMGWACTAAGMPGMTTGLQLRYHRPVPLQTPLHLSARITGTDDRKIFVVGSITTDHDRSATLVSADGTFVAPDPDRARALFPSLREET